MSFSAAKNVKEAFAITYPIIDGHNDTLLNLHLPERGQGRSFFEETNIGHIDFPRALQGGFHGGFFAIFCPTIATPAEKKIISTEEIADLTSAELNEYQYYHQMTNAMIANLYQIETDSAGGFQVIRTVDQLKENMQRQVVNAILHIEGAEAIHPNLDDLHVYYQAGLRSLGIVWSRPNVFGDGVPDLFPSSPDIGSGLTNAGKRLVRECNKLGIMIDTSHLTEKGFWDVIELSDAPIVATHSNAHALSAGARNLTDKQLDAIADSNGLVGISFAVMMLREDGKLNKNTPLEQIVRHIQYISNRIGIEHVALGSDFDGANMPNELMDVKGLPKLIQALKAAGFNDDALMKITHGNWIRVLKDTWK